VGLHGFLAAFAQQEHVLVRVAALETGTFIAGPAVGQVHGELAEGLFGGRGTDGGGQQEHESKKNVAHGRSFGVG